MRTRRITSVLLLSLYGTYGCGPTLKPSPRSSQTPQPFQQNEAANIAATQTAALPVVEGPLLRLVKKQDEPDENLFAAISERAIELALRAPQIKTAKAEVQEKPPKPHEMFPAVLQKVPGPSADDRLLELLEEDLKRAVEQSPEHRPFEFSNSVVENDRVRYYVNYYSRREKEQFAKALRRSGRYVPIIARALREEGIPEELA